MREDGIREVLGFDVSQRESEPTWKAMFASLKERGLKSVYMIYLLGIDENKNIVARLAAAFDDR